MLKSLLNIALGSALVTAVGSAQVPNYADLGSKTGNYIAAKQLPDGAILQTATQIEPYFANLAAIGLLKDPSKNRIAAVEKWITWYLNHLNWPDYNGVYGTVYTYNVDAAGKESSTKTYDSADSYAATFLTLVEALWKTGDSGAQTFIKNIGWYKLNVVGNVITNLQQSDGLVYAKPDYKIKYLMDNCECYRGLSDIALLASQAFNDANAAQWYNIHATQVSTGIQTRLRVPNSNLYYSSQGAAVPNLKKWYADSVSQLFPIAYGVIPANSPQAVSIYAQFNAAWPTWPQLGFNNLQGGDAFPWTIVSYVGYLMGDRTRVDQYIRTVQAKYIGIVPSFPWPFNPCEGGWFMRVNAGMSGKP